MNSKLFRHICTLTFVALTQYAFAADADRMALNATADLLFAKTNAETLARIAEDATFGAQENGSLLKSVAGRGFGEPIAQQIDSVTFFDRSEINTLEKAFPNQMWANVSSQIGDDRGAFVRFRLAKSSSLGSAPAGTLAMMVVLVRDGDNGPKITHLSVNDEQ